MSLRLYRDVARQPDIFSERWAQSAHVMRISGALLLLVFISAAVFLFPAIPTIVLICIGLAELIASPVVTNAAFSYAAHGRVVRAAEMPVFLSMARVLAVMSMLLAPDYSSLEAYALIHAVATLLAACLIWIHCRKELAPGRSRSTVSAKEIKDGMGLSAIWASGLALTSLDKAVALRVGGEGVAGHYVAASRFASLFALPVDSLVMAVMPRLFRAGAGNAPGGRLIGFLLAATLVYGAFAGWLLWALVGWLPALLGSDFDGAVPALGILALYIPAYCARTLGANVLLGYGYTRWRLICELVALGTMFFLMTVLVPKSAAVGAAWAAVIAETLLVILLWTKVVAGLARPKAHKG